MSNIYIQEPPCHGKVCLETSVGEIEIELWPREAPKACRNFVQLCMENYYNKTKFHRVVKDFIVQGGDPTGTGEGGESIYEGGKPFKDEFHTRLRFVRRGLVAMANAGKDDNSSQFFFTMGPTQELQSKHTLFGKVVGDTIFNMMKLQDVEVDPDDRPVHPHKILRTKVLVNPFPDIEPRVSIQSLTDDLDEEGKKNKKKPKSKMKATKDFKLLSFGDEAEDEEETLETVQKSFASKAKSSHDLLDDPKLLKTVGMEDADDVDPGLDGDEKMEEEEPKERQLNVDSVRDKLKKPKDLKKDFLEKSETTKQASNKRKIAQEVSDEEVDDEAAKQKKRKEEIRREIRALKKEMMADRHGDKITAVAANEEAKSRIIKLTEEEKANDMLMAFHAEQDKYASKSKHPKKGSSREAATMAILNKFKSKLSDAKLSDAVKDIDSDDDDDDEVEGSGWMANTLKFESDAPVMAKDANNKTDDWFDIYDPRNPMNKRRREADAKNKKH
jgi:peptidyl-prolyl cis-trans isomerase SDCCAG10